MKLLKKVLLLLLHAFIKGSFPYDLFVVYCIHSPSLLTSCSFSLPTVSGGGHCLLLENVVPLCTACACVALLFIFVIVDYFSSSTLTLGKLVKMLGILSIHMFLLDHSTFISCLNRKYIFCFQPILNSCCRNNKLNKWSLPTSTYY